MTTDDTAARVQHDAVPAAEERARESWPLATPRPWIQNNLTVMAGSPIARVVAETRYSTSFAFDPQFARAKADAALIVAAVNHVSECSCDCHVHLSEKSK